MEEKRSNGGKTLAIILLVMLVILAALVGMAVLAAKG